MDPTEKNTFATLVGGIEIEVTKLFSENGKQEILREKVLVRQLPLKSLPDYARVLADEPALIALLCNKPAAWVDLLTNDSAEQIVQEGKRVNADFFGRWLKRQFEVQEQLNPGITQALIQAAVSRSSGSSQTSPTKPA